MGLTTWKTAPTGRIRKTDVVVAKNYLQEKELKIIRNIFLILYYHFKVLPFKMQKFY